MRPSGLAKPSVGGTRPEVTLRDLDVACRVVPAVLDHRRQEIAAEMCISTHTVNDHIKVIFAKVGVTGRGELVAHLFADYVSLSRTTKPSNT
jgi:DNA-binding CsgD family transcriptional regulator